MNEAASEEAVESIEKTVSESHPDILNQLVKRQDSDYWDVITYRYNDRAVNVNMRKYYPYKYGLADKNQQIFIPCEYDRQIVIINDDRFCAFKGAQDFLLNKKCEIIYTANSIWYIDKYGLAIARKDNECYLIDIDGNVKSEKRDYLTTNDYAEGFYAEKGERLFELDKNGKVTKEVDLTPKVINSSNDKIDIVRYDNPLNLYEYYGAVDKKNGKEIISAKNNRYNREIVIIGENCILAYYGYSTYDSTGADIYDFEGNLLSNEYEYLDFYKDNGVFTQYGIAGDLIDDYYIIFKYYIINQKAEVLCELPYYSVTFKDKDTLLVQDSENASKYEVKIADLIHQ